MDAVKLMSVYCFSNRRISKPARSWAPGMLASGAFSAASMALEELVRALEKQDPPDVPDDSKGAAEIDQRRHGPGTMHGCRLPLGDPQAGTALDADVLNELGKCKVTLGREEEAIENFSEAIQLRPERSTSTTTRRWPCVFLPCRNWPEAEKCMAEMIAVQGQRQVGRRAPRLWPLAQGTGGCRA